MAVSVLAEDSRRLPGPWCPLSSVPILSPPKGDIQWSEKRPFLKGTYLLCHLQLCKPQPGLDILLNRGCKQEQRVEFTALGLQGEEELKGCSYFPPPFRNTLADPALDTTCGQVPGVEHSVRSCACEDVPAVPAEH